VKYSMGKREIICVRCGSKKVKILRYVYVCKSCGTLWDKKTHMIIDKYKKISASFSF